MASFDRFPEEKDLYTRAIKMLLVDDDLDFLDVLEKWLKRENCFIQKVTSGFEVLEKLTRENFDIIITDYRMPDMNGIEVLKAIRKQSLKIPVIILTGQSEEMIAIEALNQGADFYIQKLDNWQLMTSELTNIVGSIIQKTYLEESLLRIRWLLERATPQKKENYEPPYGNVTELNTNGPLKTLVGEDVLGEIVSDFLDIVETSSACYEKNGDYAIGIFSSGWCRLLDLSSRNLCKGMTNEQALSSGKWLCHDSCWRDASKVAIERGEITDVPCVGGLRLYTQPIYASGVVVGSINFAYGDPPTSLDELEDISSKFKVSVDKLLQEALKYNKRPPYMIEMAKRRLETSAKLIGSLVESKLTQRLLMQQKQELSEFAHKIAHDIRNDLSTIEGYIQLAEEDQEKQYGTKVFRILENISQFLGRSLELAEAGLVIEKKENADLNKLVNNAFASLNTHEVILTVNHLPKVLCDSIQITHVFQNLFRNAISHGNATEIIVTAYDNKVYVKNNGRPIPARIKEHLLQRNISSKPKYGGFGLLICRKIIESHGWKINLEDGDEVSLSIQLSYD